MFTSGQGTISNSVTSLFNAVQFNSTTNYFLQNDRVESTPLQNLRTFVEVRFSAQPYLINLLGLNQTMNSSIKHPFPSII